MCSLCVFKQKTSYELRISDWSSDVCSSDLVADAVQGINDGRVDIVIGTHKILSKDVRFKRLGLVIIDEEHRFGVRQKEALKALRAEVDVLTRSDESRVGKECVSMCISWLSKYS